MLPPAISCFISTNGWHEGHVSDSPCCHLCHPGGAALLPRPCLYCRRPQGAAMGYLLLVPANHGCASRSMDHRIAWLLLVVWPLTKSRKRCRYSTQE
uniref:Uncharacterized protein n=1 Tax=Aegilops tauschii subsp. strangulata TaxID=200361 RepID=A0A453RQ53_AEGTS